MPSVKKIAPDTFQHTVEDGDVVPTFQNNKRHYATTYRSTTGTLEGSDDLDFWDPIDATSGAILPLDASTVMYLRINGGNGVITLRAL